MRNKYFIRIFRFLLYNFVEISQLILALVIVTSLPETWFSIIATSINHQGFVPWITKALLVTYQILYMFVVVLFTTRIVDIANYILSIRIYRSWINNIWEYFWLTLSNTFFTLILSFLLESISFWQLVVITQIYASYSYIATKIKDTLPLYIY